MESSEIAAVDRRSIRHRKMAAMMVMRGAVMIFTIIGIWMMVVVVMIMMLLIMLLVVLHVATTIPPPQKKKRRF